MIFNNDSVSGTNSNWLVTINDMANYLQKDLKVEASLSSFLGSTIQLISNKFENYIGKGIIAQNYIGYYDGKGNQKLFTENYPINSVTALQYGSNPTSTWTDFYSGSATANILNYYNHIKLYNNYFPCGNKNIKIIYNAGYNSTPADIKECAIEAITEFYNHSLYGNNTLGYKSKSSSIAGTTYTYEDLWEKHSKILDAYRAIYI